MTVLGNPDGLCVLRRETRRCMGLDSKVALMRDNSQLGFRSVVDLLL